VQQGSKAAESYQARIFRRLAAGRLGVPRASFRDRRRRDKPFRQPTLQVLASERLFFMTLPQEIQTFSIIHMVTP